MCTGTRFTQYSIQSNRFLCSCSWKKVLFKEDNAKFSGKVSVKKWGIAAIDSLPGFLLPFHYFFDRNKKSEPIPNQEKVRISYVWWRLRDSIADFALGGKFIKWQPVFELAVAICHRHIAFEWVRVPGFPGNKNATRMGGLFYLVETTGLEPVTSCVWSMRSNQLS